jgi:hypothetical protein
MMKWQFITLTLIQPLMAADAAYGQSRQGSHGSWQKCGAVVALALVHVAVSADGPAVVDHMLEKLLPV